MITALATVIIHMAMWIVLMGALLDIWHHGLSGLISDVRLWLFGISLYCFYRTIRSSATHIY